MTDALSRLLDHKPYLVADGGMGTSLFALGLLGLASDAAAVELTPGDILVADTARNVVIHINPLTAEQTLLTPDLSFGNPVDIEIEPRTTFEAIIRSAVANGLIRAPHQL